MEIKGWMKDAAWTAAIAVVAVGAAYRLGLADYVTGTGYRITPVIGTLPAGLPYRPSPDEVEAVFELPVSVLLDPDAPQRQR